MMRLVIALALVVFAGCRDTDDEPITQPPIDHSETVEPYEVCNTETSDCGDLDCIDVLGVSVCAITGCGIADICPEGTTCVVSEAIEPTGVCALTGSNNFCARECSNPLECNLKPECTTEGCCNTVAEDGCPTTCQEMDPMTCEISPACPAECCHM